ncbi:single-stranded DNA-binding protein [[Clostridium] colinum]|uniref:single-stranded DNA-binding protein n=1 Tax=[Clostridium] colinum TaxID=36835 RepID=UPI0020249709|nr:single-stranded DNA-binding protein [[Clostridium] colinum]
MNKVIISGRLTRDPEIRYSQSAEPIAVTRFSVAVNRRFKREGEPDADFINCVAFGKIAEFIGKYFKKGKMIGIVGSIRTNSWTDNNGQKRISTDINVEEAEFLESKSSSEGYQPNNMPTEPNKMFDNSQNDIQETDEFYSIETGVDDDNLPF